MEKLDKRQRLEAIFNALGRPDEAGLANELADALGGLYLRSDGKLGSHSDVADKLNVRPVETSWLAESGPPKSSISTTEVVNEFLTNMADGGAAEGYLKKRDKQLRFFARQYPELPTSHQIIRVYLRQFKTADVSTRQDHWKTLSALYKFAAREYHIPNLMLEVDKPRFKKKSGQRMSRDQARLILTIVETDLEWALVTCYFGLRFRRVEAERLVFADIKSDYLIVRGKERTEELPLLPIFRDMLLKLRNNQGPDEPVFGIKADTLAYHIRQLFKRAKIEGVRGSPQTLRNTAGALWSTFGGDWTSNRQLLRHSAKTMTDHYSPLTIDELRAKDERYNSMLNLMRELGLAPGTSYQNTTGGPEDTTLKPTLNWWTFSKTSGGARR